jgi:hypothetical protein
MNVFKLTMIAAAVASAVSPLTASATTGPSTTTAPYLIPADSASWKVTSLLTAGDKVGTYTMGGIPDGLGAFDNGNGTFTVLMNHEWSTAGSAAIGTTHTHNASLTTPGGAYVSQWVIDKNTLQVVSGKDLITKTYGWDSGLQQSQSVSNLSTTFSRFCSADLPAASALYNAASGLGTQEKLFMNGEEGSANGWVQGTVVTGANAGSSYTLGKFNLATNGTGGTAVGGWENILLNPYAQDKTIAIGTNDGGTGIMNNSVAVYVGNKTNSGSEVDKAGLTNGVTKFINVSGNPAEIVNASTRATNITDGATFTLSDTASTTFSRPEDGVWSADGSKFYFVTTDQIDKTELTGQTQKGRSRLWELTFADISNPDLGGTIASLLNGDEGQNMFDNMTLSDDGKTLVMQEDTGNAEHNAAVYTYDLATKSLTKVLTHDAKLFGDVVAGSYVAATITKDEESSGVIDVSGIFGKKSYLMVTQNHAASGNPFTVEGGQLQLVQAVPVPGAVWLFGSALMGFLGFSRRNKKA